MPRINLEYSANIPDKEIDFQRLLKDLHENLSALGFCNIDAIRTRVVKHQQYYIADGDPSKAFVMLTVAVLNGRSLAALKHKGDMLLAILKERFPQTSALGDKALSIEIREMNKDLYFL